MLTSTVVAGRMGKTPSDVPQEIISPGMSVISREMKLTISGGEKIMSATG
jgi:hypothetical protein